MVLSVEANFKTMNEHVQEIFLGKYVLPEFQRTFVWNYEKVKALWESLFDGYPIGQLMFWGEATIDFPVRALGLKQDEIKDVKGVERVIVDGQQRLTAIWLVLNGDIKLYFNLETKNFTYDARSKNVLNLDILNNRSYNEVTEMNFFFANATPIQQKKFARELFNLNSTFTTTKIPFQLITNTDYNTVVSIFNRLNQQGVKLSDGQVALASISKVWKGVFRRTFDLMKRINTELNYSKNEDPDLVIQAWTCKHTGQHLIKHLAPESEKSKYFKLATQQHYEKSWDNLETAFDKSIALIKKRFDLSNYQFIPGYYPLIVVTHYLANHSTVENNEIDLLCKWFIQSIILSRYAVRSTTKFREDIKATQEGKKLQELFTHKYEALNPDNFTLKDTHILNASFKSSYSTLLYILMRKNKATDFFETSIPVGQILKDNQAWEFHHIFPDAIFNGKRQQIKDRIDEAEESGSEEDVKSLTDELTRLNEFVNSIPNLAFLIPATNQSIGDSEPSDYLDRILSQQGGKEILERQFIPLDTSLWKLNKFEEFKKKRTDLILQKVNEYLKEENLI
ncbi:DUF262 domain-containing protein [Candidatus Poribacteria bacterium]|nr:DUF262 domain-containing protein [Candidatus Poribacteria bacterium]